MIEAEKIMGGMLGSEGLEYIEQPLPPFLREPCLKLINGRSGIRILCELLRPGKVWMPSYLCHSMTDAVPKELSIEFYPINETLRVANLEWVREVSVGDMVLFVDYFGFDLHREAMQAVKERGSWILQDAAQALLSTFDRPFADFVLFSPRKIIGVPDGGLFQSQCSEDFSSVELGEVPAEFMLAAYRAFFERTHFDRTGDGEWFSSYQTAEKLSPIGAFEMTSLAQGLLRNGFNYGQIAEKRRTNYQQLFDQLEEVSVLGALPEGVVPLGFPITCVRRESLLPILYKNKIFCPVHWPLEGIVPADFEEAHRLSQKILSVLCDQRYDEEKMERLISVLRGEM
ncbi:MAG: hypothetical protein WCG03_06260 [Kiritimatiellales bacterium]